MILNVGVCKRHNYPQEVTHFIYDEIIQKPLDLKRLEQVAKNFFQELVSIKMTNKLMFKPQSLMQCNPAYMTWYISDIEELNIYVSGLTSANIAVINAARKCHIQNINIMHFDITSGCYVKQHLIY